MQICVKKRPFQHRQRPHSHRRRDAIRIPRESRERSPSEQRHRQYVRRAQSVHWFRRRRNCGQVVLREKPIELTESLSFRGEIHFVVDRLLQVQHGVGEIHSAKFRRHFLEAARRDRQHRQISFQFALHAGLDHFHGHFRAATLAPQRRRVDLRDRSRRERRFLESLKDFAQVAAQRRLDDAANLGKRHGLRRIQTLLEL
mmetsp:Transcript_20784/g.64205  ORF Transcript_20784/g.64205 Transcript_20784/m.64205 type:complete len:200 (+) Transcript_20784:756-1355(+)